MKTLFRLPVAAIVPLTVLYLHSFVHEGSHALAVAFFGGQVTEFQIGFLFGSPHVSYIGVGDPLAQALISLAGPVLPLFLIVPLGTALPRIRSKTLQGGALLFVAGLLPTMLVSAGVALTVAMGKPGPPTADVAKFIVLSGANPLVIAGAFLLAFGASLFYVVKVAEVGEVMARIRQAYGRGEQKRSFLVGQLVVFLILLVVGGVAFRNSVNWQDSLRSELNYHTRLEVNLAELGPGLTTFFTFQVQDPTTFDFAYSVEAASPISLRLVSLTGDPFPFNGRVSAVVFEGSRNPNLGYFTGFTLLPGEYALEASPASSGTLTMYINSREPEAADLAFLALLTEINAGTFTSDSYHEDGYELRFVGKLDVGDDQPLLTLPGGTGCFISAFSVGAGEVTLVYSGGEGVQTILEGSRATTGRWLPPLLEPVEIKASVREYPVKLYIYIKPD